MLKVHSSSIGHIRLQLFCRIIVDKSQMRQVQFVDQVIASGQEVFAGQLEQHCVTVTVHPGSVVDDKSESHLMDVAKQKIVLLKHLYIYIFKFSFIAASLMFVC